MNISIVIPAYNEEKTIVKSVLKIVNYCRNNFDNYEIIIVDDGSKDDTFKRVLGINLPQIKLLRNFRNKGKGYSVKKGILKAKYQIVLFIDADLAIPIFYLKKFMKYIDQGYHIVIASKYMGKSYSNTNPLDLRNILRSSFGKSFSLLTKMLLMKDFSDTQCGFKLFKTQIAKQIINRQTLNRFAFDVEILMIAKQMGLRIKEVPVNWKNRENTKINIYDLIDMFISIIRLKIKNHII